MTPTFHPPDDLLVEYAAGETPESVSLVIACHATLCPTCRAIWTAWTLWAGPCWSRPPWRICRARRWNGPWRPSTAAARP